MLEQLVIKYLVKLLNKRYSSGSQITIRSDGIVYYKQNIKTMKHDSNLNNICWGGLVMKKLFEPGIVVKTKAISESIDDKEINIALNRHLSGDFGIILEDSIEMNNEAIRTGNDYILSAYMSTNGKDFWIKTEWDRSVTTVLYPEEY